MISLKPMNQSELDGYLAKLIPEYADEHVKAGNWDAEGAVERSKEEIGTLLPKGVESPNQHLFSIHDDETNNNIGILWFAEREEGGGKIAFIYDIELQSEYRGKGWGAEAMPLLEPKVRELGIKTISLHVFGKNAVARNLYEKMGYEVTNVLMSKQLKD